jgi:glutamate dehydrogenase
MITEIDIRTEVLAKLSAIASKKISSKETSLLMAFAKQYYANVPIADLQARSIAELYGALVSHWELICQRKSGQTKIRVYNPNYEQYGWQSPHTVVEVATDDMPFLVDSLRMKINREGFAVHFMIHLGGVKLHRDKEFHVVNLLPTDDTALGTNDTIEAPIYIEIDRQSDPKLLEHLHNSLARVLDDVRLAVEDWSKMRNRMQDVIQELESNPPSFNADNTAESIAFLSWLDNDHFTYLGSRDYDLVGEGKDMALQIVPGSGLGILRNEAKSQALRPLASMPPAARALALAKQVLVISKTNTKSTIHRPVHTDYIGVKRFNKQGQLIGERRFIGLYTSTAYNTHPKDIPLLCHKIAIVLRNSQLSIRGHAGKELMDILATLPRDDLFQANTDELTELALGILHIQQRQQIRLFVRQDAYRRFISCLVYVPRVQFNTELNQAIENILLKAFNGLEVTSAPLISESALVRVHYLIRTESVKTIDYDVKAIEARLIEAARSWKDELNDNLTEYYGEEKGIELSQKYAQGFPASYKDDFSPWNGVYDINHMEALSDAHSLEMNLYRPLLTSENTLRFKLFRFHAPIILSDVLPMLENMGLRVIDERPYQIIRKDGNHIWLHDFGLIHLQNPEIAIEAVKHIFQEAFARVWYGEAENDAFNRLILGAQLTWREAAILRAYTKYLRQLGFTFSQNYVEATLAKYTDIAKSMVMLFKLYFDPTQAATIKEQTAELHTELQKKLEAVTNLDEDRILRRLLEVINATLRTNYFQQDKDGQPKTWLAIKLDPKRITDMPLPRPLYEVFVYSPRVEAIHLRAAKVARGGIRWSDRREDFRTEVLGLMKAQQVKNTVIVPAGAKGGFIVTKLPQEMSREAYMEEVITCYQTFMRGLLDLTDNLQAGEIVPPQNTVRYDDDDPYLVVAADKGTASFSDIANGIAKEYDFWLGDAFASGGSAGYDHKKMGITARGAWESVKRHLQNLHIDPTKQDFTVVGIGDMSGDVFGNGMLLSKHIKLVAAFNHLHIFLDPNPDPEASFKERERLFHLPRSTWEDYNSSLISKGGAVFRRALKSIPLSPEVKQLLELDQDYVEPNVLIQAILRAPVDLLWNGGIGTYVKSSAERQADVGDKTNDAVRVNGSDIRARAVGEGGNLGFTQLGRVEYALKGGLIYTDFIDNSAGVDCSDHEVNSKILLNAIVANGDLTLKQRNNLLADMTAEIAELILHDNASQTRAISLATFNIGETEIYRLYIGELERSAKLNRALEFLPDDKIFMERKAQGKGLTSPEIAILLAYAKMQTKAELLQSDVIEDPYLARAVELAFPQPLRERYHLQMENHSLRREIIATQLTNTMIDNMGITFVYRMQNRAAAQTPAIVRAFAISHAVFSMQELTQLIEKLDHSISTELRYKLMLQLIYLVRRGTYWFLRNCNSQLADIADIISRFKSHVLALTTDLRAFLVGSEQALFETTVHQLVEIGIDSVTSTRLAGIRNQNALLDIITAAIENNFDVKEVATTYFAIGEHLEFSWLREQLVRQTTENAWEALARAALRDDLDMQQRNITVAIMSTIKQPITIDEKINVWVQQHTYFFARWQRLLAELRTIAAPEFIMLSVAVRELTDLFRQKVEIKCLK